MADDFLSLAENDPTLEILPTRVDELCKVVQGLLIHDAACRRHYGPPPPDLRIDRTTLPVAVRIARILERDPAPLTVPRSPFMRDIGTCRDFAAMLCAFVRRAGREARVRCGFAGYLGGNRFEDHWVCEYREASDAAWRLADAQLDPEHRAVLDIAFPIDDVPRHQFLTADQAWRRWRSGDLDAGAFGHGATRGERFLFVNLLRDALASEDRLTSAWDRWREFDLSSGRLTAEALSYGDEIASGARKAGRLQGDPLLAPAGRV